jgi:hypothetical protein
MWFVERLLRARGFLVAAIALTILSGCGGGPATGEVSGTVTLNGKAPNVEGLQINFLGPDGRPVAADVSTDGTFKATGVLAGEVQVGLSYAPPEAAAALDRIGKARPQSPEEAAKGPGANFDPKMLKPEFKEYRPDQFKNPIPERFRDPRTSQKTLTVEAGKDNAFTWDVRP